MEPPALQLAMLMQSASSWDGIQYESYPDGRPLITILKITIAPNTIMKWHSHPAPNAGVLLSGNLTIETFTGTIRHFKAGAAIPETVHGIHRGITGTEPAELIVFYAGVVGLPLSLEANVPHSAETRRS